MPIADLASAFNAAFSILVALRTRDRTGRGEFVDVSIFDTAVSLMVLNLARYMATGEEPVAGETILTGIFPFYHLYETKDERWMAVAAVEPKFWSRLCEVLGVPELEGAQFVNEHERADVVRILSERFRTKTQAEWESVFLRENLPVIGIRRVSEVVKDPQVLARSLLPLVEVPGLWPMKVLGHPAKHSDSTTRNPARAPAKGEDTEPILRSLGYSDKEIRTLARKGVVVL